VLSFSNTTGKLWGRSLKKADTVLGQDGPTELNFFEFTSSELEKPKPSLQVLLGGNLLTSAMTTKTSKEQEHRAV